MNDIELHIGPRKCGKSEIVENELNTCYPKLYVGTLLDHEVYKKSLVIHKERRRGKNWYLYETSSSLDIDFVYIEEILQYEIHQENGACMIDGLTTWITNSESNWDYNKFKLIQFLEKVLDIYVIKWRLIDVSPIGVYYNISSSLHDELKKSIKNLKIIGYEEL